MVILDENRIRINQFKPIDFPNLTMGLLDLFVNLPAELKLEVLSHCGQLDLVCLSLTNKYFRDLTLPLAPIKPHPFLLEDLNASYRTSKPTRFHAWDHQYGHHRCNVRPGDTYQCKKRGCRRHCARCLSCPLYARIKKFMEPLRFCQVCEGFTPRLKKNKGRCKAYPRWYPDVRGGRG